MKRTDKGVISWKQKIFPYVLIAPNTIIFVVFIIVPAICGIYYSMTEWKGIGEPVFIGLANYAQAFTDAKFWTAIWHNCVYAVITLPLIIVIPLLLANLLIQKLPGKGFFRAIIYWPSMISYIVTGVAFKFIFGDASGIINYILSHFGMEKIEWMTQGTTAMAVSYTHLAARSGAGGGRSGRDHPQHAHGSDGGQGLRRHPRSRCARPRVQINPLCQ